MASPNSSGNAGNANNANNLNNSMNGSGSNNGLTVNATSFPAFVGPSNYPSRPTHNLVLQIAEAVVWGATPRDAAGALGISPGRINNWLRWGRQAAENDVNQGEYHDLYLALYLVCLQAQSRAKVIAQQQLMRDDPAKWLMLNPETRGEWNLGAAPTPILEQTDVEEQTADITPPDESGRNREVLRMLVETGAAMPLANDIDGEQHGAPVESPGVPRAESHEELDDA